MKSRIYRFLIIIFCLSAMLFPIRGPALAGAETLDELIAEVRARSILIDAERCPDSIIKIFFNQTQENIATLGSAIQKETLIELSASTYRYALPVDVYLIEAVILNGNPDSIEQGSYPKALKFVPRIDYGTAGSFETGRPQQWTQFKDSLAFNRRGMETRDTVRVCYFAHATAMDSSADSMALPQNYKKPLIDMVVLMCFDRISLTSGPIREQLEKDIAAFEQKLLGRSEDVR